MWHLLTHILTFYLAFYFLVSVGAQACPQHPELAMLEYGVRFQAYPELGIWWGPVGPGVPHSIGAGDMVSGAHSNAARR